MTLNEAIQLTLTANSVPDRVTVNELPDNPIYPASVYIIVYRKDEEDLAGNDCALLNARIQVDTFAPTEIAAELVAKRLAGLMRVSPYFVSTNTGGFCTKETSTRLFRETREYSLWMSAQ